MLDLGLPGIDGIDVIAGLRGWTDVPIIVLSARDAERDKVAALDAGADDYVTKPFGMDELLARLRAALRRADAGAEEPVVDTPDFTVDLAAKRVHRDGREVHLTPTEWDLVEVLVRNPGKLVTQRQLLQEVWGPQYGTETNYLPRPHGAHPPQARARAQPPPLLHHRAGHGLPLRVGSAHRLLSCGPPAGERQRGFGADLRARVRLGQCSQLPHDMVGQTAWPRRLARDASERVGCVPAYPRHRVVEQGRNGRDHAGSGTWSRICTHHHRVRGFSSCSPSIKASSACGDTRAEPSSVAVVPPASSFIAARH